MSLLGSLGKYKNTGLLVLRIGLGLSFLLLHGYPKLVGGPEKWQLVGSAMGNIGVNLYPVFWGFMAGFVEAVGGLFLLLGLFYRPTCILLAFTMFVAALFHIEAGQGLSGASHALEIGFVFLGLLFVGPGNFRVDKK
jgi:putative oxidoreductase